MSLDKFIQYTILCEQSLYKEDCVWCQCFIGQVTNVLRVFCAGRQGLCGASSDTGSRLIQCDLESRLLIPPGWMVSTSVSFLVPVCHQARSFTRFGLSFVQLRSSSHGTRGGLFEVCPNCCTEQLGRVRYGTAYLVLCGRTPRPS